MKLVYRDKTGQDTAWNHGGDVVALELDFGRLIGIEHNTEMYTVQHLLDGIVVTHQRDAWGVSGVVKLSDNGQVKKAAVLDAIRWCKLINRYGECAKDLMIELFALAEQGVKVAYEDVDDTGDVIIYAGSDVIAHTSNGALHIF
jgi:hypothetical protein